MRLRFWIKESLKISAIVILASLFYGIFLWVMMDDFSESPVFVGMVFMITMGGLYLGIFTYTAYYSYLSVAVAFGSTRKEALAGMRLFRLIFMGVIALAALILAVIHYGGFHLELLLHIPLSILLDLLFSAGGMLAGIANIRRGGKAAAWVFGGFAALLVALAVLIVVLVLAAAGNVLKWVVIALVALIPVVHILCLKPEKKTVEMFSVKL